MGQRSPRRPQANPDRDSNQARPRRLGVAVIGAGWMGQLHSRALSRVRHHFPQIAVQPEFVVVADPVADRRRALRDEFGYLHETDDWRSVVDRSDVDLVSITAPNDLHRDIAVAAAGAGKHFWLEKPSGRNLTETAEIARAASEAEIVTAVGLDYRCAPAVVRIKQLLDSGHFGKPVVYRGWFLADYACSPDSVLSWRFERSRAGAGVIADLLPHVADMAILLTGPISSVHADAATFIAQRPRAQTPTTHFARSADQERFPVENEDYVSLQTRFANGARGLLECGRTLVGHHVEMAFELYCERGSFAWNFERMNELQVTRLDDVQDGVASFGNRFAQRGYGDFEAFQPGPAIPMGYDDLKVIEASRLLTGILSGQQGHPGIGDMLRAAEVMSAAERSVETGEWTPIEPLSPEPTGMS